MQKYDFENSVGFIVNCTAKAFIKALDSELRKEVGVTFGQWKVMVILVNQNGMTQKEIADKLGLEGPTLIPIIDKMETDGLVVRRVDLNDRRNNRIYHTQKARNLWNRMISCALKIRKLAVKNISDDKISELVEVLKQMYQNLTFQDISALTNDLSPVENKLEKKIKVTNSLATNN
jgi:MarR family transcriptional regulator for hemolysin